MSPTMRLPVQLRAALLRLMVAVFALVPVAAAQAQQTSRASDGSSPDLSRTVEALSASMPTDADNAARISPAQMCELQRTAHAVQGVTAEPVMCAMARGELPVPQSASGEERERFERSGREAASAMDTLNSLLARDSDDYFYCKVLLCMGAPNGPERIEQCVPVIERYRRMLRGNVSIPACPMVGLSTGGNLDIVGAVGNQGRSQTSGSAGSDARESISTVARYGELAHQRYGIACNDVETMIVHSGENEALPRNPPPYDWSYRGAGNTAIAAWEYQPDWWRRANPQFAGHGAWNRLMPWFVVFEGDRSPTSTVDVQIGRMSVQWFSSRTQSWHLLDYDASWAFSVCAQSSNYYNCPMGQSFAGPGGHQAFTNGNGRNGHGWFEMLTLPDPRDVGALTVTVEARLIGANAHNAQLLMHVGADIYPPPGTPQTMLAGAAVSSMRVIDTQWTSVSMTTFAEQTRNGTGITRDGLRANPPPCAGPAAGAAP